MATYLERRDRVLCQGQVRADARFSDSLIDLVLQEREVSWA